MSIIKSAWQAPWESLWEAPLTPLSSFDLIAGRPWIGLGNELKSIRFKP